MLLAVPMSHPGTQYMDFVEIFNISLDLSAIYFAHFTGRMPKPVFWSQVKYEMVLFYYYLLLLFFPKGSLQVRFTFS